MINPLKAFNTQAVLIAAAVSLAAGLAGGWTINGWRLNAKISDMQTKHSVAVQEATVAAMNESDRLQKVKDEAIEQATKQAQANAAAAAAARNERDRLRDDLVASRSAMPDATHSSLAAHAQALSVVFEQCTKEYSELAAKADGHTVDTELLFNAWTKGATK